ncbi:hypothetical protein VB773_13920 [Haloarculaceae archaeon H-GB2-1]|nr:hypothetical protein [Haloarculaceae archaeon H-GB1-1]MEA5387053.1 hypothetical protein [Haloarculaceae archaeon H-GB11]MEA5408557.1 hypothetical protein [Haloarculaceae archaeon H-GB2-1]
MSEQTRLADDVPVREFDYGDVVVYAADLDVAGDPSAEVVGDTVIVVVGDDQYDFELPEHEDARAFIKNGVLTIEVTI